MLGGTSIVTGVELLLTKEGVSVEGELSRPSASGLLCFHHLSLSSLFPITIFIAKPRARKSDLSVWILQYTPLESAFRRYQGSNVNLLTSALARSEYLKEASFETFSCFAISATPLHPRPRRRDLEEIIRWFCFPSCEIPASVRRSATFS